MARRVKKSGLGTKVEKVKRQRHQTRLCHTAKILFPDLLDGEDDIDLQIKGTLTAVLRKRKAEAEDDFEKRIKRVESALVAASGSSQVISQDLESVEILQGKTQASAVIQKYVSMALQLIATGKEREKVHPVGDVEICSVTLSGALHYAVTPSCARLACLSIEFNTSRADDGERLEVWGYNLVGGSSELLKQTAKVWVTYPDGKLEVLSFLKARVENMCDETEDTIEVWRAGFWCGAKCAIWLC